MDKSVLDRFRHLLLDERASTIDRANRTVSEDAAFDTNELTDEIDQATAEYDHGMVFKLCDRENNHLRKIKHALQKISNGKFGICEECGDRVSPKRLEARPVTTLCVVCKEEQEMEERSFGE